MSQELSICLFKRKYYVSNFSSFFLKCQAALILFKEEAIYDVLIVAAVFQSGVKIFLADVDLSFYSRNNF